MDTILDHPIIRNCEDTGYPDRKEEFPICPICGEETDTIYKDREGEIVGCDECIRSVDAWEVLERGELC